jgi:hypothetical protein
MLRQYSWHEQIQLSPSLASSLISSQHTHGQSHHLSTHNSSHFNNPHYIPFSSSKELTYIQAWKRHTTELSKSRPVHHRHPSDSSNAKISSGNLYTRRWNFTQEREDVQKEGKRSRPHHALSIRCRLRVRNVDVRDVFQLFSSQVLKHLTTPSFLAQRKFKHHCRYKLGHQYFPASR